MTSERVEWVEIIEPRTKNRMYANLSTGECVWDPPEGVNIKRADASQWWELFDANNQRFYYYNVASQSTVWHRPPNCDIIPLAKLQTLKQNTDPGDRKEPCIIVTTAAATATTSSSSSTAATITTAHSPHGKAPRFNRSETGIGIDCHQRSSTVAHHAPGYSRAHSVETRGAELLCSPQGRHSYRLPSSSSDVPGGRIESHKYCRHTQGSNNGGSNGGNDRIGTGTGIADERCKWKDYKFGPIPGSPSSRTSQKHNIDSGKSSDSSLSSVHGYRRLQEGGSLRIGSAQSHKNTYGSDNCYRMLQESSSSHNIPQTDLGRSIASPTHSISTPQLKKKLSSDCALQGGSSSSSGGGGKRDSASAIKHQSFDYTSNPPVVSLTRSGSFMSSPRQQTQPVSPHNSQTTKNAIMIVDGSNGCSASSSGIGSGGNGGGGGGGGASDDSMHEKYFKSVENTPASRRRHGTTGATKHCSSDSSPQSPTSPSHTKTNFKSTTNRPALQNNVSIAIESAYNLSSQKSDPELLNLDLNNKPDRYLDKMRIEKGKVSPGSVSNTSALSIQEINSIMKQTSPINKGSLMHSSQSQNSTAQRHEKTLSQEFLTKCNLDRQQKEGNKGTSTQKRYKKHKPTATGSDVEYDNGNISPLYSNWDQEMQEHLLPLQHYILEQAKLSGCYRLDDTLDSDSLHSDSQSEHSLSGHEPDNEDSDHSDDRGDYLTHHYGGIDEYGAHRNDVSYYNFEMNFDKSGKGDISTEVEAKLENERDIQLYSPIKNHPLFHRIAAPVSTTERKHKIEQTKNTQQQSSSSGGGLLQHLRLLKDGAISTLQKELSDQKKLIQSSSASSVGNQLAIMKECDIEKFAQDNLNLHAKGIFRKKSSIRDMLSWTSDAISRPMLALSRDKAGKKMATELFKLVQIYMADRKARPGMSLNSVALDIITMAVTNAQLRDELYVQLCRQTTENPMRESLIRGWELLTICLSFIPPSPTFQPALLNYMNRHRDPTFATSFPEVGKWPIHVQVSHYATIACRRLDRIGSSGKKQAKRPSEDEINQARDQIFRDSMFGNTLTEVMALQKELHPDKQLPWVQLTLSEQVLLMNGKQTEGIFRVPADADEVNFLKNRLDRWEIPEYKPSMDAHAPASLLKLWYRELYDPLIPDELYNECVATDDPKEAAAIINRLPQLNRLVLSYLVHFLQQFAQPDIVTCTKMDSSNLAMVFAPNCLRCTSHDPKVILENARKEMAFMRTLIQNMDTSDVASFI